MGFLVAVLICAAESGPGELPALPLPPAELRRVGVAAGLGVDTQWTPGGRIANAALWGELEFSFRVLRWLRLELLTGAAWSGENRPSFPGQHGTLRALAGVDFIIGDFRWGELFVGAAGGVQHTNLIGDEDYTENPRYSTGWSTGPCLVARSGVEFRVRGNLSIGGGLAYGFFLRDLEVQHSGEVRVRAALVF